jgi:hypothetical protein
MVYKGAMRQERTANSSFLILLLFGIPFAAIGVITLVVAVKRFLTGSAPLTFVAFLMIFALVFGGVGFGVIFGGRWGLKEEEKKKQFQAAHPDTPWMWREDWACGHIQSSTKSSTVAAWGFAILWNLISSPILFVFPRIRQESPALMLRKHTSMRTA